MTLRGTVPDRWMKRMAEDCVESCQGVKDVRNELRVESHEHEQQAQRQGSMQGSSQASTQGQPSSSQSYERAALDGDRRPLRSHSHRAGAVALRGGGSFRSCGPQPGWPLALPRTRRPFSWVTPSQRPRVSKTRAMW